MFKLSSTQKHILHCLLLFSIIIYFEIQSGALKLWYNDDDIGGEFDPFIRYGRYLAWFLYIFRLLTLLPLPQVLFNFFGLICFNAFPDEPRLEKIPLIMPFICIRTVTRGDYPELVNKNVERNLNLCLDKGLENFIIEIVSDKLFDVPKNPRIRLTVVPSDYQTKSGALFKARALQYCLEDNVNRLNDNDWIVHLDEETLLTSGSIAGIVQFVCDGKYQFGQGLITYANEEVVNWLTTLSDAFRVAEDMGKLRFQFYIFHKPIFSWKGSYVVTLCRAERDVSFDNGPDGSIAEDCYFSMIAFKKGYTFNFIEGEMWEKSPFTLMDCLQQRKRWLQGIFLVVHSPNIPLKIKFFLTMSLYAWATLPLSLANLVFALVYPLPASDWCNFISTFVGALTFYLYIFGVFKSFKIEKIGYCKYSVIMAAAFLTIPLKALIEIIAVIWGLLTNKHRFFVVQKQIQSPLKDSSSSTKEFINGKLVEQV
uniref:Beta-1,4-mannosyltransferase egh-like n=1 Tax=Dermatophagoides pteronyssinus TaxID=6956 RepID=A0A6P6Y3V2_DERPT|nr:beta-1,4-mannosyltransferase egh-like [Dermatophagoides pteronyssinus]